MAAVRFSKLMKNILIWATDQQENFDKRGYLKRTNLVSHLVKEDSKAEKNKMGVSVGRALKSLRAQGYLDLYGTLDHTRNIRRGRKVTFNRETVKLSRDLGYQLVAKFKKDGLSTKEAVAKIHEQGENLAEISDMLNMISTKGPKNLDTIPELSIKKFTLTDKGTALGKKLMGKELTDGEKLLVMTPRELDQWWDKLNRKIDKTIEKRDRISRGRKYNELSEGERQRCLDLMAEIEGYMKTIEKIRKQRDNTGAEGEEAIKEE